MTTSNAVRFQVVGTPRRRVVAVSPGARPDLHLLQAHPARQAAPGRTSAVAACAVSRPAAVQSPWLAAKVAVVSLLAVVGGAVSVTQLIGGAVNPDPSVQYVAGDPGWAHVAQP
ncbi:MAG TPA: hypothetical protein GX013_01395 [Propionibacterium sp.]|nr:hypothetical protein [Propionibacterium sp.]